MNIVGVDVGGTFTDAVVYDDASGRLRWAKVPSTPSDPAAAVVAAVHAAKADLGATDRFVHGVTIGTNAIIQRRGGPVWMLVTAGFRDTLEIARTNRTQLYDITTVKPPPIVARANVLEVHERLTAEGTVLRALDTQQLDAVTARLSVEEPAALAVCFLHSYANPEHETAAATRLRSSLPNWFVCSSAEVLPEMREYERFNTAALNAYVGPIMDRYLETLTDLLRQERYSGTVYLTNSSGGILTASRARRLPVHTVLSGPAGGVAAAVHFGRTIGLRNLITYDMGGTSTDVCLVQELEPSVTTEQEVAGLPIRTPQIEINTVGAGGGSIAWIDAEGRLGVGPQSAGADPGPACYGKGATEPTLTDANVVLGRLAPVPDSSGAVALKPDLAQAAVQQIADRIADLDTAGVADGMVKIAVARMVSAIKEISVQRGHDPRDFALMAFGGAGPLHAAFIAQELDIMTVIIPPAPANFCAFGALISDIRHDHVQSFRLRLDAVGVRALSAALERLETEAGQAMAAEGMAPDRIQFVHSAGLRYVGQSWELIVRLPDGAPTAEDVARLFAEAHERRFGYSAQDAVEVVSVRVAAVGLVDKPALDGDAVAHYSNIGGPRRRTVYLDGSWLEVPVYQREQLPTGDQLGGPAIIEEMGSVTVVPQGWTTDVGVRGTLRLTRVTS